MIEHSWIIPCYQDEATVEEIVQRSLAFLGALHEPFEIVLINDGSTDGTGAVCRALEQRYPMIRAIHHPENRGYGDALRTGFQHAQARSFIGYTDGDAQYDPQDLHAACERLIRKERSSKHAVLGSKVLRADGIYRSLQSLIYNHLLRSLFRLPVRDVNCSLKWFPAPALKALSIHSRSAFIDAEILLGLERSGVHFEEVPVRHFSRREGRGFGARPKVIWATVREMFSYFFNPPVSHELASL